MSGRQDPGNVREGTGGSCYIRGKDKSCSVIILYGPGPFFKQGISLPAETGLPDESGRHKKSRGTLPGVFRDIPRINVYHDRCLYHDPDSNCCRIRRRNSSAAGGKTPYFFQARCSRFSRGGQSGRKVRPVCSVVSAR